MSTFYLVRHGSRASQLEGTELSDHGTTQAEETAQCFANKNIQECSFTSVEKNGDEYHIKEINNTHHLSLPIM